MSDTLSAAADTLREQIQEKVERVKADPLLAEIFKMQATLNGLEDLLGRARTVLPALFGFDAASGPATPSAVIAIDEFVNLPALDAAKRYLRKAGKPARSFADIVRGVRAGGGVVNYEDKLKIQLVRSGDVKKVGDDSFGLAEWYPARKGRPPGEAGKATTKTTINTEQGEIEIDEEEVAGEEENGSPVSE
jgi:hypothetical protein